MFSRIPKVLHTILGKPIVSFVVDLAQAIESDEIIVVSGKYVKEMKRLIGRNVKYALQAIPLGSGDAAKKGIAVSTHDNVLILNGDVPLLVQDTIVKLIEYHHKRNAAMTILTCEVKNPFGYGRIVRGKGNKISDIVEQTDATIKQQKIGEINAGVYYGNRGLFLSALNKSTMQNRQGEYYLTDVVAEIINRKKKVVGLKIDHEEEIIGINSRFDLAIAREIVKAKWFARLMARGVYIEDPLTINIDLSVQIGRYVHIRPHTIIEGNTKIKDRAVIGPFVWIKNGKKINLEYKR